MVKVIIYPPPQADAPYLVAAFFPPGSKIVEAKTLGIANMGESAMNRFATYRAMLAVVLALLISPTLATGKDRDVEAGPLWSDKHAKRTCPQVCREAGAKSWTGQWHTTKPATQSVCSCQFDRGAVLRSSKPGNGSGSVIEVEATFGLPSDWNAKNQCPKLCEGKGLSWTGKWAPVPNWAIRWTCSCR